MIASAVATTVTLTVVAIALAVLAASQFGLAAVDQHQAVREVAAGTSGRGGWRVVTRRGWLRGGVRATVAGGLHVAALALAPIMLVQPIGVLAVPVAVVAGALRRGGRPRPRQALGSVLAVLGVVGLTVTVLHQGTTSPGDPPPAVLPLLAVVPFALAAVVVERLSRQAPPPARCAALAVTAATLFGLTSVLVRTAAQLVTTFVGAAGPVRIGSLATVVGGLAICALTGLWAVQIAYAVGSPQVVLCCLTLVDPLVAIAAGAAILHETPALSVPAALGALGCIAVAVSAVVLLSADHPVAARHHGNAAAAVADRDLPNDDRTKQKVGALS